MFSSEFEKVLNDTNRLAMNFKHPIIDVEHLLYILMDTEECIALLSSLGVENKTIKDKIDLYFETDSNYRLSLQKAPTSDQVEHSDAFKRVIQRAIFHAQALGQNEVNCVFVLVAILSQPHTQAYRILQQLPC